MKRVEQLLRKQLETSQPLRRTVPLSPRPGLSSTPKDEACVVGYRSPSGHRSDFSGVVVTQGINAVTGIKSMGGYVVPHISAIPGGRSPYS